MSMLEIARNDRTARAFLLDPLLGFFNEDSIVSALSSCLFCALAQPEKSEDSEDDDDCADDVDDAVHGITFRVA